MGVSISEGTADVNLILIGGDGFAARLDAFRQAARDAHDAKLALSEARTEADAILASARKTQGTADQRLAENELAAEHLRAAQEVVDNERSKIAAVLAIMRE